MTDGIPPFVAIVVADDSAGATSSATDSSLSSVKSAYRAGPVLYLGSSPSRAHLSRIGCAVTALAVLPLLKKALLEGHALSDQAIGDDEPATWLARPSQPPGPVFTAS